MPAVLALDSLARPARMARLYVRPLVANIVGRGLALAGGPLRFDRVEVAVRDPERPAEVTRGVGDLDQLQSWAVPAGRWDEVSAWLQALTRPRPAFAGLDLDRPRIMAVINVTPDSFSDGGDFLDHGRAVAHGRAMRDAGADILDIGGESTRPGAEPVPAAEEIRRVVPVIEALAADGALVSIDSRHAEVMAAALDAGAVIVNDVTALTGDPDSLPLVARRQPPTVLMHMQGEPQTMQASPHYGDVVLDVFDHLERQVTAAVAAGLPRERLVVDPGIGFGKTVEHNLALLREATLFHGLGCAVLCGVSRKSFIGRLSRGEPAKERVPGSLAAGLAALDAGVQILRVHDVAETAQAVAVWRGLRGRPEERPLP